MPCSRRLLFVTSLHVLAACANAEAPPDGAVMVDAPPSTIPRDPAGSFEVATTLDLPVPEAARPLLDVVARATDDVDDPMRFVLDHMIAALPDGAPKTLAKLTVPFVAAYLDEQLAELAPRLAPGLRAIADGLARVTTHIELAEAWTVDASGAAVRVIRGVRFDVVPEAPVLTFSAHGFADATASTRVSLDRRGGVAIERHVIALRHGTLVRLGLDRAVIPSIEPRARDLSSALVALVDCKRLGELVAAKLELGSSTLYATACAAGMNALASEVYEQISLLDEAELELELAGTADGYDLDGDGSLDEMRAGQWRGSVAASFSGARSR